MNSCKVLIKKTTSSTLGTERRENKLKKKKETTACHIDNIHLADLCTLEQSIQIPMQSQFNGKTQKAYLSFHLC